MTFADLPQAAEVFLDANPLVFHFTSHPVLGPACSALIERVQRGEIRAFTSTHVLAEATHRLMTIEGCNTYGWPIAGIAKRLERHPAEVRQLTTFRQAIDEVLNSRVQVVDFRPSHLGIAMRISQQTGLLTNDALVVALMQEHQLTNLASQDADFDLVGSLTRYAAA